MLYRSKQREELPSSLDIPSIAPEGAAPQNLLTTTQRLVHGLFTPMTVPLRWLQGMRSSIDRVFQPREVERLHSHGTHRASALSVRALLFLTFITGAGAKATHDVRPIEQPFPTPGTAGFSLVSDRDAPLPSPNDDIERIMEQLDSPERTGEFLRKSVTGEMPKFPVRFLQTYRKHPRTFLGDGKGACNAYANFFGEWSARKGITSYTVSLCPRHPVSAVWNSWHQVQVICIRRGERYLIFDNGQCTYCDGDVHANLQRLYPDMTVIPYGGIVPWKRTTETVVGALSLHTQGSVDETDMVETPELEHFPFRRSFAAVLR